MDTDTNHLNVKRDILERDRVLRNYFVLVDWKSDDALFRLKRRLVTGEPIHPHEYYQYLYEDSWSGSINNGLNDSLVFTDGQERFLILLVHTNDSKKIIGSQKYKMIDRIGKWVDKTPSKLIDVGVITSSSNQYKAIGHLKLESTNINDVDMSNIEVDIDIERQTINNYVWYGNAPSDYLLYCDDHKVEEVTEIISDLEI
ncbi:hypothetical protein PPL_04552 [Heterostelium album PN500]|uniref:Uncharacterized protein n=1 Tax=Heterostelium pallidum (strain ATCC 26659 / Pp 5 / PN500) TaxID=670386 RepID=D3B7W4_HETP5|nr:hypothetical protein PPL_04552 [Heterostelium album PN500]EFA82857.1 hypothetical protein PPL_04552 [Heterostelium album PN500]|eukprot:XP_020434974.1 hypothetical protein PPL_04552 [Heterostelium album PN500]